MSNLEEGAIITSSGTYQKGFTNPELKEYVSGLLGDMFEVENITGLGKAGIKVTKLKPTDKRLGFFEGTEVDNLRLDGTKKSQIGHKGRIKNNVSGKIMTELSAGKPNTEEGFYPLLNHTLQINK